MQEIGEFARKSGLTGTLQTGHQDDGRRAFEVDLLCLTAHEVCQLVMGDLDHQLSRTNGIDHILAQRFLLHAVGKLLRRLVVHIRLQQGFADVLDRFRNVDFRYSSFTLENLERPF